VGGVTGCGQMGREEKGTCMERGQHHIKTISLKKQFITLNI
jgi:hypothetical protein